MQRLIFLSTFIISLLANMVYAQFSIGVIGGVNFADMKADAEIKSRTLSGFGGIIEYSVIDQFSLVALPMYIQNGGIKIQTNETPELRIKGSYIDVPIFLKYSFPYLKVVKPFLFAGPSLVYRLESKMEGEMAGLKLTADLKNVTRDFDLGLGFGAGVEIPLGILSVVLEGKYFLGLVDQHKNGTFLTDVSGLTIEGTFDDTNKFKNRGIQVLIGITFPISN